jgi:hypothetical protein
MMMMWKTGPSGLDEKVIIEVQYEAWRKSKFVGS